MYKTIDCYEFARAFEASDTYKNNFTRPALMALYNYLEEYENSTGENYEFDMVALCCEYSEYKNAWEAMEQYQPEDMPTVDEVFNEDGSGDSYSEVAEKQEQLALEWLQERTTVITFEGGVIIAQF